jgi:DNA-binding XRE family transcriptional regulator
MTIGESMRKARKDAGMTLNELAEKSGWRSRQISTWERDRYQPRLNAVIDLADTLGISIDEYVGHKEGEVETMPERALTHKQIEWAYTKWCEGYTLQQIADALYVCEVTVRRAINGRPRIRPILKYEEKEGAGE